jgi:F-type H+-transporting ATPase subunit a
VMIAMGSVVGLFGFENPATSIWYTLGLASISFIGIYVVGITANGIWGFIRHKYANPLELFTQFAPLLSLSVRLFGSTFAFAVILNLVPILLESMGLGAVAAAYPVFASVWHWVLVAGDFALSMIQAYVFMVLTMMYWKQEQPEHERKKSAKAAAKAEARAKKKAAKESARIEDLLKREYDEELEKNKNTVWNKTRKFARQVFRV